MATVTLADEGTEYPCYRVKARGNGYFDVPPRAAIEGMTVIREYQYGEQHWRICASENGRVFVYYCEELISILN